MVRWFLADRRHFGQLSTKPLDAFSAEGTQTEAETAVCTHLGVGGGPWLSPEHWPSSTDVSLSASALPRDRSASWWPGASAVEPRGVHYPFHHMWNAYSPFREMPERSIHVLGVMKELECPTADCRAGDGAAQGYVVGRAS
jgi:hypothetical protein